MEELCFQSSRRISLCDSFAIAHWRCSGPAEPGPDGRASTLTVDLVERFAVLASKGFPERRGWVAFADPASDAKLGILSNSMLRRRGILPDALEATFTSGWTDKSSRFLMAVGLPVPAAAGLPSIRLMSRLT